LPFHLTAITTPHCLLLIGGIWRYLRITTFRNFIITRAGPRGCQTDFSAKLTSRLLIWQPSTTCKERDRCVF
jgi:hypothetical protein